MMAAITASAFPRWTQVEVDPRGNFSREVFRSWHSEVRVDLEERQGWEPISVNMVPNYVHDALWRELNRFTLRNGDTFSAGALAQPFDFFFFIQITDNGQSWYGWVWRQRW